MQLGGGRGDYIKNFGHVRAKISRRKMGRNLQKLRKEPEALTQTQPTIKWTVVADDHEVEDGDNAGMGGKPTDEHRRRRRRRKRRQRELEGR